MPIIIDFNGYFLPGNEFIIKEYSLLLINKNGKVKLNNIEVTEPLQAWEELDELTKKYYKGKFYSKFGIDWTTGTDDFEIIQDNIIELLTTTKLVYIRDNKQKELLINFLDTNLKNEFVSLVDDLGYNERLKMSTYCNNHEEPYKNNCANDNAIAMYEWLKKTKSYKKIDPMKNHVVVDFNGFYIPINRFVIKEFNAFVIDDVENVFYNENDKYFITQKPMGLKELPFDYRSFYESYYETFGIEWGAGDFEFRKHQQELRNYFNKSVNIYVRNNGNKKLLLEIIGHEYENKIIVLQKFGYQVKPRMETSCPNHNNKSKNNCAMDNSENMVRWIIKNKKILNITDLKNE
ncbi:putative Bracovirus protein MdBV-1-16 [Microplitis demolitor]